MSQSRFGKTSPEDRPPRFWGVLVASITKNLDGDFMRKVISLLRRCVPARYVSRQILASRYALRGRFPASTLCAIVFAGAPTGSCQSRWLAVNSSNADLYNCLSGSWSKVGTNASNIASGTLSAARLPSAPSMTPFPQTTASPAGFRHCWDHSRRWVCCIRKR